MDTSLVGTQVGSTLLAVGGMQLLKKATWVPIMQEGRTVLNRFVSIVVAGGIALGIHFVWTAGVAGDHTLTVTIPSIGVLATGAFHWASQFIYQETGYSVLQGLQSVSTLAKIVATAPTAVAPAVPATAVAVVAPKP